MSISASVLRKRAVATSSIANKPSSVQVDLEENGGE